MSSSIDYLERIASQPARRRAQQSTSHHPWKSTEAWAKSSDAPAFQPDSPTASRVPRVSQPLRVEPPPEYNAPARVQRLQRSNLRATQGTDPHVLSSKLARRPLVGAPTLKARPEKMRDYSVLAAACQRAGRQTRAAHLTFNQGVLCARATSPAPTRYDACPPCPR